MNTKFQTQKINDFSYTHHFVERLLSDRFNITENQLKNLFNYTFTKIEKNSSVLYQYPHLRRKMREGQEYYYNIELNMFLCVSDKVIVTVMKLVGTDYSDYTRRNIN